MIRRSFRILNAFLVLAAAALIAGCDGETPSPPPVITPPDPPSETTSATRRVEVGDLLDPPHRTRSPRDGDVEIFHVDLDAGRVLRVRVEQHGVDAKLELFAAGDDTPRLSVDGWTRDLGDERLEWVAEEASAWRLEITASVNTASVNEGGSYTLVVDGPHPADTDALARDAAMRAFDNAERLFRRTRDDHTLLRAAAAAYEDALNRWRALGDAFWQAEILYRLGRLDLELGRPQEARARWESALPLFAELDHAPLQALIYSKIGDLFDLGRVHHLEEFLEPYHQALELRRRLGDDVGTATVCNNLGVIYWYLGEAQDALRHYHCAAESWQRGHRGKRAAITLHNLGRLDLRLGNPERALEHFEAARDLRTELGDLRGLASTETAIAQVYAEWEDWETAEAVFQTALARRRLADDTLGEAVTRASLAMLYSRTGRGAQALENFEAARRTFQEADDPLREAVVLLQLGRHHEGSDPVRALELYREVERLTESGDRDNHVAALLGIASARRRLGELEAARETAEKALDLVDDLRTKPAGDEMRSAYFASKQSYYDFYIDLLMELHRRAPDAGWNRRALAAVERSRSRSLLELIHESGGAHRASAPADLRRREAELRRLLSERQLALQRLAPQDATRSDREKEILEPLHELERVRGEIRLSGPLPKPQSLDAATIQARVVDARSSLLEYKLGEERSFVWLVTPDAILSRELPGRAAIEALARPLAAMLSTRQWRGDLTAALLGELGETLLGPVADLLPRGAETPRLLISSEGILQYIPFAALHLPGTQRGGKAADPLVEHFEILRTPSASALDGLRRRHRQAARGIVVLADPIFQCHDPRLAEAGLDPQHCAEQVGPSPFERLAFSEQEAGVILDQTPPDMPSIDAKGFDAHRDLLFSDAVAEARYLHIATHGVLSTDHPELTRLALASIAPDGTPRDGSLRAYEIYNLDLRADLVTLSACRTALGREVRGEGLVGLTQSFLDAGAASVLVSLWNVDDERTAELMGIFYRRLFAGDRPAAALRAAQLEIRRQRGAEPPYFWAAFVVQGHG